MCENVALTMIFFIVETKRPRKAIKHQTFCDYISQWNAFFSFVFQLHSCFFFCFTAVLCFILAFARTSHCRLCAKQSMGLISYAKKQKQQIFWWCHIWLHIANSPDREEYRIYARDIDVTSVNTFCVTSEWMRLSTVDNITHFMKI